MKTKIEFDDFWKLCSPKRDKAGALRVWKRMSDADRRAAIKGVRPYIEACQAQGVNLVYPCRYLSHRRWEDEIEPARPELLDQMRTW